MKLFFSIPDEIETKDGAYYSNPISVMVERYGSICDEMICFAPIKKTDFPDCDQIKSNKVIFICAPKINSLKDLSCYYHYKSNIKSLVSQCDACIIHVHTSFVSTIVADVSCELGIPYLTVVVGCPWDSFWNHGIRGKLMAPLAFVNLWRIQRKSRFSIYVTSKFLQERYPTRGYNISCSNVELSDGNVSISERKQKIIEKHLKGNRIATIAALDVPYKGQEYTIRAISKLKELGYEYEYFLVGNGDPARLKKIASENGVSNLVHFIGAIPHSQIATFLDEMDIYIQPSKQEGLPRALIEAMSRGCFCLGSNIAGIPELLDKKYLFQKGDISGIVEILSDLSMDIRLSQAEINIAKSLQYKKSILDEKRAEILLKFKMYVEIDRNVRI